MSSFVDVYISSDITSAPNKIFRILGDLNNNYVIDLENATKILGNGSKLLFCGGTLKDGEIYGINTTVIGAEYGGLDNVKLSGTYTNSECDLSWWGCVPYTTPNDETDNSPKIKNALESTIKRIRVGALYGISSPVDIGYYSHIIIGCSQMGEDNSGFIANSNFQRGSVRIENTDYPVRGMFCYYKDQHPAMDNLCILANKKADYAFEQIIGQPSIDFKNIYITEARIAGIVQYGCEHLRWEHVMVRYCGIGIYISTNTLPIVCDQAGNVTDYNIIQPDGDEDPMPSVGDFVSMDNMLNLISCRVLDCNYGFVIKSGTNTSLINCESAYNSIFGLYTYGSTQVLTNYYSEGDGRCNFWIDVTGNKQETLPVKITTCSYLREKNKDGIKTKNNKNCFNEILYLRAPIYFDRSLVTIQGLYTSIAPRSSQDYRNISTISLPTQRTAAGVDAVIIAKAGKVTLEGHHIYMLSSDDPTLSMPFKTYIAMSRFTYSEPAIFDIRSFKTNTHEVSVWYANNSTYEASYSSALIGKSTQMAPSFVAGIIRRDYNKLEGAVYGPIGSRYDMRRYATFREFHNGIPLFQLNDISKLCRNFTQSEIQDKFGDISQGSQVRLRLVMRVVEDQTMAFNIQALMMNSSNIDVYTSGETGSGASGTLAAGYYDIYMRLDLTSVADWHHLLIRVNCPALPSKVYFSDFLFYDNEDGQILPPPTYYLPVLWLR